MSEGETPFLQENSVELALNTNANLLVGNILFILVIQRKKKQTFVAEIELNYGYNHIGLKKPLIYFVWAQVLCELEFFFTVNKITALSGWQRCSVTLSRAVTIKNINSIL